MKIKNIKQKILFVGAVGISIFALFFIITCSLIGYEVQNNCQKAKAKYGGTCTKALSLVLDDETKSFRERNDAIWALGQLGNKEALPMLQKYYTGNIPEREPLNEMISQYELKKAIKLAEGSFNMGSLIWRIGYEEE